METTTAPVRSLGVPLDSFELQYALDLTEAAKLLRGRGGRNPHRDVVRRWCNPRKGCVAGDGSRIVLPAVKLGGELLVMRQWVEAFQAARMRRVQYDAKKIPLTTKERERSYRLADARLRADGI